MLKNRAVHREDFPSAQLYFFSEITTALFQSNPVSRF